MRGEATILPPPDGPAAEWRLPLVPTRRPKPPISRRALVDEALAARSAFDHVGFLSALTALANGPALRRVDAVARLASEAYGGEAIQLVAVLAGRWVHAMRPDFVARRRVAQTLVPKVRDVHLDASGLASLLTVDPSDDLWLDLARRMHEPPFLVFDIIGSEMARSPDAMLGSLRSAARWSMRTGEWWRMARGATWSDTCLCADCVGPHLLGGVR